MSRIIYEAGSNDTLLGIFLGERVEAIKSSPHGRCDRYSTDVRADVVPQHRCCWRHCTIPSSTSSSDRSGLDTTEAASAWRAGVLANAALIGTGVDTIQDTSHKHAGMTFVMLVRRWKVSHSRWGMERKSGPSNARTKEMNNSSLEVFYT
jgi:hypothetical protein